MVIDDKDRNEGEWKERMEINKTSAFRLKSDVEGLKKSTEHLSY